MVALLGREDPLLSDERFPRLLRQANDAEVADVRKLAEDRFEVSPHRTQALAQAADAAARAATGEFPVPAAEPASGEAPAPAESARSSATLRFRRGSRGPARPSEVLLVGAVKMAPEVKPAVEAVPVKGKKVGRAEKAEKAERSEKAEVAAKPAKAVKAPRPKKPKVEPAAVVPMPAPAPAPHAPAETVAVKKPNGRRRRGGRGRSKPKA
jgi:hypothetical protein